MECCLSCGFSVLQPYDLGALSSDIAAAVGVTAVVSLLITTVLVFIPLFIFGFIADALGGASFNPTGTATFYAAVFGGETLFSAAL